MDADITLYQKKVADVEAEKQRLQQQLAEAQQSYQAIAQELKSLKKTVGVSREVDAYPTAEARLRQQQAQYRQIFETITDGLGVINLETGELVEANPAYHQMHGYSYEAFMAVPFTSLVHPHSWPLLTQFIEAIQAGRSFTGQAQNIHHQGHIIDIEVKGIPYPYNGTTHALAIVRNISDRKRLAANLRLSEARLTAAFEQAAVGFAESDMQTGRLTLVNTRFCEMTGYSRDELTAMTIAELTHPEDVATSKQAIQQLFSGQIEHFALEKRYCCKDGSYFWSETTVYLVNPPDQQATYCMAVVQDIRDRKASEDALKQSEEQFRTLVDNINGAVYRRNNDTDWTMEFISDAIHKLSGYPATDFIQSRVRTYGSIIHPDDAGHVVQTVGEALAKREPFTLEYRILHRDGSIHWVYEKGKGIFDSTDQLFFIEGVFFDITEGKVAQAEKESYQKKLEFLIRKTTLGIIEWNTQFEAVAWNPAAAEIFGYGADEMLGQHAKRIVPLEFQPYVDDVMTALVENKGGNYSINENCTKADQTITCEWINTVLYDAQKNVLGIYSVVQDITARIRAETELKQSEANLRLQAVALAELSQSPAISQGQVETAFREITERTAHVLEVGRVSIWLFDPDHTKLCCQDLFELATQRHSIEQELLVADYPSYFAALEQQGSLAIDDAQNDARTVELVKPYLKPLGITSVLNATLGSEGKISGVLCLEAVGALRHWQTAEENFARSVANLVTLVIEANQRQQQAQALAQALARLQNTQLQLVQSEKMSSVGQLVAGVAHEINNPVSFIHGNLVHADQYVTDLLRLIERYQVHYPDPHPTIAAEIKAIDLAFVQEDLGKLLRSMHVGTERIQKIVESLRNFSRLDEAEVKDVDLHEGIDSTLLILRTRIRAQSWRPEIQVIKDYGELPPLTCYAGQLNQVFMNLLSNAIDALEERDENRSLDQMEQDPSTIQIRTQVVAENGTEAIEVAIADNGLGIDTVTRDRLFNPFFTTKAIGKGTGLGLSISYQIITEKHQGTLEVMSEKGQGATFVIHLPLFKNRKQIAAQKISS